MLNKFYIYERLDTVKKSVKDIFVVGFALFSMLFGAGNVIFPPYLGLGCGSQWVQGFIYYYLADIALALVCLFAIQRGGGQKAISKHLGKAQSEILNTVIILCIGPMLGIPRTAASTFEMSITPVLGDVSPIIFSVLFFILIAVLCMKETSIIDIIGKILTPTLIVGLLILIIKGIVSPLGPATGEVLVDNVPATGIKAGYQTMDVLAVSVFGILISKSIKEKGYDSIKKQNKMVIGSGAVAGMGLLIIYLGLSYLGATASGMFDLSVDHTYLVTSIVKNLLGDTGEIIFAVVVALACVTTAVALVSSCSDYFTSLSNGKVKYGYFVIAICTFSAVVTTFGLNKIIAIAAPILDVVYPPTLFIIILSYFDRWIKNDWIYRLGALSALIVSFMTALTNFGVPIEFLKVLPLYSYGFGWVVPAIIFAVIGAFIPSDKIVKVVKEA